MEEDIGAWAEVEDWEVRTVSLEAAVVGKAEYVQMDHNAALVPP